MRSSNILRPLIGASYKIFLKPILFKQDAEKVHDRALKLGNWFGSKNYLKAFTNLCFGYKNTILKQRFFSLDFENPVGLAAGFDKNANLINILAELGFGFAEIGSVTGQACSGNAKPRLWRLPKSKSLIVYYGLANLGAAQIAKKIQNYHNKIPLGINIAKTNDPSTDEPTAGIADYLKAFQEVSSIASYITINISCPNTSGGQPFTDPLLLEDLLSSIGKINHGKTLFIKLSPDLSDDRLDKILEVISRHRISGLICSNLTHNKDKINKLEQEIKNPGGFSGKALEEAANALLKKVYKKTRGQYILVGCGGVFSAEDAYKKIRLGASLVQIITGMIYEGPQLISEINHGLAKLLKRDGYTHISQAIGVDNK